MSLDVVGSNAHISHDIRRTTGWGEMEFDEFRNPFQWIGTQASVTIQPGPGNSYFHIYAGSPDFNGIREISVTAFGKIQSRDIIPGWNNYEFELGEQRSSDEEIEVTINIDRLLDIENGSRNLGIMIRELQCFDYPLGDVAWKRISDKRNLQRRSEFYSSADAPSVVWLASFPRSGNTWTRFLLTNLLFEPVNQSSTIADYIDAINDPLYCLRDPNKRELELFGSIPAHLIKSHLPFSLSMPLRGKTVGAIYILRNPLDVAVSLRKWNEREPGKLLDFLTYGVEPDMSVLDPVSWHAHVFSWMRAAREFHSVPVFLLKYEDLVKDTHAVCKDILQWLQIEKSSEQIQQAVERSSLGALKKMESKELWNETSGIFFSLEDKTKIEDGWRFLSDGKSNNYRNYLSDSEIQIGLDTFGSVMKTYGYI